MFDPFKDFETAGYLRNRVQLKNSTAIKRIEHASFLAALPAAIDYLSSQRTIVYTDFLKTHEILFGGFYPWAGQDRSQTAPDSAIGKGGKEGVLFAHPLREAQLAVEEGLRMAQDKKKFIQSPGTVMGYFAYGHPFLDGNGRTMLLVHSELAKRAGFYINWSKTSKNDYLKFLTQEIQSPEQGILDSYLSQFQEKIKPYGKLSLDQLIQNISGIKEAAVGVDQDYGSFNVQSVHLKYQDLQLSRRTSLSKKR